MTTGTEARARRLTPVRREEERVMPLELFFDLVFVLALTQCTALMADQPTWEGLAKGLLVLALLWWAWTAYAWLTSIVNPEEGGVRLAIFAAMAALVVVALCVPQAFGDLAITFAVAYAAVRAGHIALYLLASRDEPQLRSSVSGLAISTAVGVGLLVLGALVGGTAQVWIWALALLLDLAEPYFFGAEGWQLVPTHFAERHGLVIIIALGESIVAIGVGAELGLSVGMAAAAVLGIAIVAAMWWLYFDVVALVSARRLSEKPPGREQNEMARDSYSYLHFPMVAGIVLLALGLKEILGDVDDPLATVPAFALLGGVGLYLLAHVAFRLRNVHTLNRQRLALGLALFALVPIATEVSPLLTLSALTALLCAVIAYETISYGEARARVRHRVAAETPPP